MSVTLEQDLDRIVQRIRADERASAIAEVCAWLRDMARVGPGSKESALNWAADAIEAKFGKAGGG